MAELGVIASGMGVASLAMQIGESIMKLKKFIDAAKEAPADIRNILERIETLRLVLIDMSSDDEPSSLLSTAQCLLLCRRSADTLHNLVKDLENDIHQRRILGGVKYVLKKGTLNKLKDELRNAQEMLMLSHQANFWALQKQQYFSTSESTGRLQPRSFDVQGEVLEPTIGFHSGSTTLGTNNTVGQACKTHNTSKSKKKELRINTASLSWLTKRAWEICCYQAYSGWNVTIRTYNVLPDDSQVFSLALNGDVAGLQEMFQTGKASMYDVDSKGWTLLDLAAIYHHLDACRMLLEEGADPNVSAYGSAVAMAVRALHPDIESLRRTDAVSFDLIRCLTTEVDQDIFSEELSIGHWNYFGPPTDAFEWLFQQLNPYYTPRSVSECWRIALEIGWAQYYANSISLIRVALKGWDIDSTLCNTKDVHGCNLIWYMAYYLGEHYAILSRIHNSRVKNVENSRLEDAQTDFEISDHPYPQSSYAELLSLIKDLLIGKSNLDKRSTVQNSTFLGLLAGFFEGQQDNYRVPEIFPGLQHEPRPQDAVAPMRAWVTLLREVEIDLVEYGRTEYGFHLQKFIYKVWDCKKFGSSWRIEDVEAERVTPMRLISFTYGPSPSDWNLWITEAANDYAATFWQMIEHPELAMPGAWDEEEGEDWYDWEMYDEDDCFIYPYISATDYKYEVTEYEQGMGFNIPFEIDESSSPTTWTLLQMN